MKIFLLVILKLAASVPIQVDYDTNEVVDHGAIDMNHTIDEAVNEELISNTRNDAVEEIALVEDRRVSPSISNPCRQNFRLVNGRCTRIFN